MAFRLAGMVAKVGGGYAIAGIIGNDPAVLHVDADGNRLGFATYPGVFASYRPITALAPTSDGGLILAGWTQGPTGFDALLIKLGSGVAGAGDQNALPCILDLE
jgi:hypothetical protein